MERLHMRANLSPAAVVLASLALHPAAAEEAPSPVPAPTTAPAPSPSSPVVAQPVTPEPPAPVRLTLGDKSLKPNAGGQAAQEPKNGDKGGKKTDKDPATPADGTAKPPEQPGIEIAIRNIIIRGQNITGPDPETGLITVTGNPRLISGSDEVRATRIILNQQTNIVTAEGNVIIFQDGQEIRAGRATYDLNSREGDLSPFSQQVKAFNIKSERVKLRPGPVYLALRSRMSTCDLPHPHYELHARETDIVPGQYIESRHVGIDLLGMRLMTIPKLRKSLKEGEEDRSLLPSLGYSSYTGPYAEQEFPLLRSDRYTLTGDVRLNTWREPQGGLLLSTPGRLQIIGALYYRDEAENQRSPHMQVSRLPEIALIWGPERNAEPGRFMPHQVASVRAPKGQRDAERWFPQVGVSGGFFRQHRGEHIAVPDDRSQFGARMALQAQVNRPKLDLGPITFNDIRVMMRQTLYDNGERQLVVGTGIGRRYRFGNWEAGISRFDQYNSGTSPFRFDQSELKQEWRPHIAFDSGGFSASYFWRVRGDNVGLYDHGFAISKLFHCIRPTLTYRVRRNEIGFEIRIPGLSGRGRTPGRPSSVDFEEGLGDY